MNCDAVFVLYVFMEYNSDDQSLYVPFDLSLN